ncbi:MAG: hypothetical protein IH866_01755, partial [Chloroflexi bacterium]|nr:hypothetical protein [Chloroflexota bacterium]
MTKVRSRPRPKTTGKVARSRPGRPNVGRRRSRPSPLGSLGRFLFRLEAIGITLVALAVISVLWLVPATRGATDLRDGFVRTFGLMVFAIIGLVAYLGLAVVRRRLDQTFASYRPWLIVALLSAIASGLLGFFRPDWQLGNVALADITAGGDLAYLMAGSLIGILAW